MKKLSHDQRIILAEFMSNFALIWISFGFVGPIFTGIESIINFIIGVISALFVALISLKFSLSLIK